MVEEGKGKVWVPGNRSFRLPGLTVVGVTGGMATGKSFAAQFLQELLGCNLIDADRICRELLGPGQRGLKILQQEFGERFLRPNQTLDRQLLRIEMFKDRILRERLNVLLHPLVKEEIANRIKNFGFSSPAIVLLEVPLLFEAGWQGEFDKIVVIVSTHAQCVDRLKVRDKVSSAEAELALKAQWPQEKKAALADFVIDNSDKREITRQQLRTLAASLVGGDDFLSKNNLDMEETNQ